MKNSDGYLEYDQRKIITTTKIYKNLYDGEGNKDKKKADGPFPTSLGGGELVNTKKLEHK